MYPFMCACYKKSTARSSGEERRIDCEHDRHDCG